MTTDTLPREIHIVWPGHGVLRIEWAVAKRAIVFSVSGIHCFDGGHEVKPEIDPVAWLMEDAHR